MAAHIIAALRTQVQLHGNSFLVATELAHRLNSSGYGRVAYQFLAWKAHCSRRTAIRQIDRLIDQYHLFRKTVIRTREGYAWNLYQYVGPRTQHAAPPVTTHGDTVPSILPEPEREKELSLAEQLARQRRALQFMTEGGGLWHRTQEEITRLITLTKETPHDALPQL